MLAVTQRRENLSRNGSVAPKVNNFITSHALANVNEEGIPCGIHQARPSPVTRHFSFVSPQSRRATFLSGSDVPSPLSVGSLQSLLMSSQVAIFNSSTERLSLSSQNQIPYQQPVSCQHHQHIGRVSGVGEPIHPPFSISPAVSASCVHFPQPSYFDEPPPSYQESMLTRKLRASERIVGNRVINLHRHTHFGNDANAPTSSRFSNCRRSCRT